MPPQMSTPKILHRAGELRTLAPDASAGEQTTPAEKKLWAALRLMREDGIHFRRQHALGSYITDFCAPRRKLIIELDGSQHLDQQEYDAERTMYLELRGYQVLRFWNHEVMNHIDEVLNVIWKVLREETRDPQR